VTGVDRPDALHCGLEGFLDGVGHFERHQIEPDTLGHDPQKAAVPLRVMRIAVARVHLGAQADERHVVKRIICAAA